MMLPTPSLQPPAGNRTLIGAQKQAFGRAKQDGRRGLAPYRDASGQPHLPASSGYRLLGPAQATPPAWAGPFLLRALITKAARL
jgi:hypothetical protein